MQGNELVPVQANGLVTASGLDPARAYLLTLRSQASRTSMRKRLDQIARMYLHSRWDTCPWHELEKWRFDAIVDAEFERVSVAYTNQAIAAVRGVMTACFVAGLISADRLAKIRLVKSHKVADTLGGRYIPAKERTRMFQVCQDDPSPMGRRDSAIFALMFGCGLRRVEIRALDLADVDRSDDSQWVFLVNGKGRKRRQAYVSDGGLAYMRDYICVRGDWPGPLFPACHKSGSLRPNCRLTDHATYALFRRRAQQSGIEKCRPHDARRSWVTSLLESGADVFIVALLAGHSQIQTTRRYDLRPEKAARQAARTVGVTYLPSR